MAFSTGSEAGEIFHAVGRALTYWEEMDEVLFDCFVAVCGVFEPTLIEGYLGADRQRRFNLIRGAVERYGDEIGREKSDRLMAAAKAISALAKMRNEIAHGRCQQLSDTRDGKLHRSGVFLVPSRGYPWKIGPSEYGYYHSLKDIADFIERVREVRWDLRGLYGELINSERYQKAVQAQAMANRLFKNG